MAYKSPHPKKAAFLAAFENCGTISEACRIARIDRSAHYDWMASDPDYPAQFAAAEAVAAETMEAEARRRAIEGWDEPVFHNGEICGTKRKFSDTLLIFMLKGAKPEKYRDRVEHSGSVDSKQQINIYLPDNGRGPDGLPPMTLPDHSNGS